MPRTHLGGWIAAALLLIPHAARAQYVQQGGKVVAPGSIGSPAQGTAVAVSADGSTAMTGGPGDNNGAGAVWLLPGGAKLTTGTGATGTAAQGTALALSSDGSTAIVGGPKDNDGTGAIWVYFKQAQQGPKLWGTVLLGISYQGTSVAISGDGNTALVGGPWDSSETGAAWVFYRTNGAWSLPDKLVGSASTGKSHQGAAVALSADGNTAIIGGPGDISGAGAAWIFTRTGPGAPWTQQGNKLAGFGAQGASAGFGTSVALSGDGNTAMVGGSGDNNNAGAVWVFTRSSGQWGQQGAKLVADAAPSSYLGQAVALTADGNTAVVGEPGGQLNIFGRSPSIGAAWIFARNNGAWMAQSKLIGTGSAGNDALQGTSVAITADGTTVYVGGPTDNVGVGAVWIFSRPPLPVPPSITTQPASQTIANGQTATLTVAANGSGPLSYQWYRGTKGDNTTAVGTNSPTFTTPALTVTTNYWVRVSNSYGSADSNTATITVANPGPLINSVSNAAPGAGTAIAANTWLQINGTNLAPSGDTRSWRSSDFAANQMPIQLDGVSVTVNGKNAFVSYISPTQVNILTPPDAISGTVQVQVSNNGLASTSFPVQAQGVAPAFFVFGAGPYVAAEHTNGSYLAPPNLFTGVATTPAKPGEIVALYANGFGPATPPVTSGSAVQSGTLPSNPLITIGGIAATVQFAGLVFPGEYQFNVVVPTNAPDGDNLILATYAGVSTQAGVLITVAR
jgi:uncharacterized protein (TIGR03437 family)